MTEESFQQRLFQSALDRETEKIRNEYANKDANVQTLAYDLSFLNNEEKKEIRDAQRDFVKNQVQQKEREAKMQTLMAKEAYKDEKNAYSDNALRRTFALNPARTPTITSRLRDDDVSYMRDTSGRHFQKLRGATVRLRNLKDDVFANRVDRIFHETREVEMYDRFVTLMKEARGREQRLTAMRAYIAFQFRKNNYSEIDVDLPVLFKVSANDMRELHIYRVELFRKGLAASTAAMTSTVCLLIQSILAILAMNEMQHALKRNDVTGAWGLGLVVSLLNFIQIYLHRRALGNLEGPGIVGSVVGFLSTIGIALYVTNATHNLHNEFKHAGHYKNMRQLVYAVVFMTIPTQCMFYRAIGSMADLLSGTKGKNAAGSGDKKANGKLPIQGMTVNLISLSLSLVLPYMLLFPSAMEAEEVCSQVSLDYCLSNMKCAKKQEMLNNKAYSDRGRLKDCIKNANGFDATEFFTGSFSGIDIPHV